MTCPKCNGLLVRAADTEVDEVKCVNCGKRVFTRMLQFSHDRKAKARPVAAAPAIPEREVRRRSKILPLAVREQRQRAYRQRPEVKARQRAYRQRPEVKARQRAYRQRYFQKPEVKARQRAYRQRPEVKARHRDRMRLWMRKKAAAARAAAGQTPVRKTPARRPPRKFKWRRDAQLVAVADEADHRSRRRAS
jgi:DNA-directed RNA polymerase subunit M/transcription elongation factor TFIIS